MFVKGNCEKGTNLFSYFKLFKNLTSCCGYQGPEVIPWDPSPLQQFATTTCLMTTFECFYQTLLCICWWSLLIESLQVDWLKWIPINLWQLAPTFCICNWMQLNPPLAWWRHPKLRKGWAYILCSLGLSQAFPWPTRLGSCLSPRLMEDLSHP